MTQKTISHELAKECIFTALMLLMEKQDYEKITITDIARRAGVSRMTYYRVYQDKDDIIKTHLIEAFDQMVMEINTQNNYTENDFFRCFFETVKKNEILFHNALKANMLEFVWRKVKEHTIALFRTFFRTNENSFLSNYRLCFFCRGISPHCPGMAGNRHAGRRGNDGPPVLQYHRKNTPGSEYVIFVTNRPDL